MSKCYDITLEKIRGDRYSILIKRREANNSYCGVVTINEALKSYCALADENLELELLAAIEEIGESLDDYE